MIEPPVPSAMTSEVIAAGRRDEYLVRPPRLEDAMQRRDFMATLAAGSLAACASGSVRPTVTSGVVPSGPGDPALDAAQFNRERRWVETPFGRIAYVERGRGRAALFLHGLPLNGFQWRGALERLSSVRRVIAPDFLGLGYTEVAAGQGVGPRDQVAMIIALLDRLNVDRVDLVANDSGGAVAQLILVAHPQRVRTLLLTNCDTEPDSPPPAVIPAIAMARAGTMADTMLAPWVRDKQLARSTEGLGGQTFTFRSNPTDEAIDYYLGPLVSTPERKALVHAYTIALDPNPLAGIEPVLKRSVVPARILWGTGDTIFSPSGASYLDRVLGNSRGVRWLEGAKLFWPEEFPDIIAEEAIRLWGG